MAHPTTAEVLNKAFEGVEFEPMIVVTDVLVTPYGDIPIEALIFNKPNCVLYSRAISNPLDAPPVMFDACLN